MFFADVKIKNILHAGDEFLMLEFDIDQELRLLQESIQECRVCESFAADFQKPAAMKRGPAKRIVVVGQGPGKQEITSERPFAGQAGKRLDKWLIQCGADPADPRFDVYTTSVTKCYTSNSAHVQRMARRCEAFTYRQLHLIQPEFVISLGGVAYPYVALTDRNRSRPVEE